MALKAYKALESQVHETLYKNIYMITYLYPPNKDFWEVFKKDMFVKNNKTAFNQVVYYLLRVLNPAVMKEKVPSWPIFDPQYERLFRAEVMKYLNELNDIYENARMPQIMTSQLVSPGGFKFAKYMLKLSILVMYNLLQSDPNIKKIILTKPNINKKNNESLERQLKKINSLTKCINEQTEKTRLSSHNQYVRFRNEAENLIAKLNDVQNKILLLQENLKLLISTKLNTQNPDEECKEKVDLLIENLGKIKNNCDKLIKIKDLLNYLLKEDLVLRSKTTQDLDLIALYEKFNLEMERHCLEMTTFTDADLDHHIEKFYECNMELSMLKDYLTDISKKWMKVSAELKMINKPSKSCKRPLQVPTLLSLSSSSNSTVLAVPLEDSNFEEFNDV